MRINAKASENHGDVAVVTKTSSGVLRVFVDARTKEFNHEDVEVLGHLGHATDSMLKEKDQVGSAHARELLFIHTTLSLSLSLTHTHTHTHK